MTIRRDAVTQQNRPQRLGRLWPRQGPVVMAILNCTPDSFSDGGRFDDVDRAITHAQSLIADGAQIIDVGGESTRPGAAPVDAATEMNRVVPVIADIRSRHPEVLVSVDTSKTEVADAALAAGADIVNDVRAGTDEGMFETAARHHAGMILMHMRGEPRSMQDDTSYLDLTAEVQEFLLARATTAMAAGIERDQVWLDPGIGFGKDDPGNLCLLARLPDLAAHGFPIVVGPSRKSFIGRLTGAPVGDRLAGSLAGLIPSLKIARAVVRVHDPAPTIQFLHIAGLLEGSAA